MKDVGKFYEHLVYITAISYILWPFGIFCGNFGTFFTVLVSCTKDTWQPWSVAMRERIEWHKEANAK
jgi:hypothetical protein